MFVSYLTVPFLLDRHVAALVIWMLYLRWDDCCILCSCVLVCGFLSFFGYVDFIDFDLQQTVAFVVHHHDHCMD